ncbi:hypothetical protein BLTE_28460 [Blastochloris tepida]|uniref:Uncharacterized protein n=1 Tax=Blastochloris tepida TaxID=2233851 RepID=A0A348G3M8_9HYPH|nr:hypothetical protein BLTE_28460 [Blastochloris tepida]
MAIGPAPSAGGGQIGKDPASKGAPDLDRASRAGDAGPAPSGRGRLGQPETVSALKCLDSFSPWA